MNPVAIKILKGAVGFKLVIITTALLHPVIRPMVLHEWPDRAAREWREWRDPAGVEAPAGPRLAPLPGGAEPEIPMADNPANRARLEAEVHSLSNQYAQLGTDLRYAQISHKIMRSRGDLNDDTSIRGVVDRIEKLSAQRQQTSESLLSLKAELERLQRQPAQPHTHPALSPLPPQPARVQAVGRPATRIPDWLYQPDPEQVLPSSPTPPSPSNVVATRGASAIKAPR